MIGQRLSATSFRDPAGFMFVEGGVLYRQINKAYKPHYETLCESGLAEALFESGGRFTIFGPRTRSFVQS